MATFLICGDPHGSLEHIVDAADREKPTAVILLGDLELRAPLDVVFEKVSSHTEVWWIPGNHDTEDERAYDFLFESKLSSNNLHGRVVDIGGVRFAGLGGVFRSKVWSGTDPKYRSPEEYMSKCGKGNHWRGGLPLRHRSSIFPSDVGRLIGQRADVLVTHEAPGEHQYGSEVLSELSLALGVRAAFHGHHHESIRYPDKIWHGVGLRSIARVHGSSAAGTDEIQVLVT